MNCRYCGIEFDFSVSGFCDECDGRIEFKSPVTETDIDDLTATDLLDGLL